MKKIIGFGLLGLMLFLCITLAGYDNGSKRQKIAQQTVQNISKTLNKRYQLLYKNLSGSGSNNQYKKIGIYFDLFQIVDKEESRKILVGCVEEMLKQINTNLDLRPYLQSFPFTVENIELVIYIRQEGKQLVYYPDLGVLSVWGGLVRYKTEEENKYKTSFYTEDEESYAEALKIVQAQANTLEVQKTGS